MRIGCCVNMLASEQDPIGAEHIAALKRHGYDYVELPLAQVMELSEDRFQALCDQLTHLGLVCECCNNFFPANIRLTGDAVNQQEILDYLGRSLERAHRLGVGVVVFGSAKAKNVPEGFDPAIAFGQVVWVLQQAGRIAAGYGIVIVIEPLNRQESNLILTLGEGEQLMQAVNEPQVCLLADYYHFQLEHEKLETLRRLIPSIRHVHFAEPDKRVFPQKEMGQYDPFFAALREGGYDLRCSLEAFSHQPSEDLSRGVRRMARYR